MYQVTSSADINVLIKHGNISYSHCDALPSLMAAPAFCQRPQWLNQCCLLLCKELWVRTEAKVINMYKKSDICFQAVVEEEQNVFTLSVFTQNEQKTESKQTRRCPPHPCPSLSPSHLRVDGDGGSSLQQDVSRRRRLRSDVLRSRLRHVAGQPDHQV